MRAPAGRLTLFVLLTLLVGCDHATKFAAKANLEHEPPRELLHSVLDIRYVENVDIAFNLLRWVPDNVRGPALVVSGALAVLCLAAVLLRRRAQTPVMRGALLLTTAGALGNYIDRIWRGYVVDFVHIHHWPVFNVADVYVTIGTALLATATMRPPAHGRLDQRTGKITGATFRSEER